MAFLDQQPYDDNLVDSTPSSAEVARSLAVDASQARDSEAVLAAEARADAEAKSNRESVSWLEALATRDRVAAARQSDPAPVAGELSDADRALIADRDAAARRRRIAPHPLSVKRPSPGQ